MRCRVDIVNQSIRLENAQAKAETDIVSALLKIREGRLFFAMLLEESGFLKNGFRETPEQTAFAEGERSIGGRVFNLILSCAGGDLEPLKCMSEYREWCLQTMKQELNLIQKEESEE